MAIFKGEIPFLTHTK